jgi:hypothetical protein
MSEKTKLVFMHILADNATFGGGEITKAEFVVDEGLIMDEFLSYFVRFALAAGYQPESIEDSVIDLANEYKKDDLDKMSQEEIDDRIKDQWES